MRKVMGEVQKLTAKIEFLEEENGKLRRMSGELASHVNKVRASMADMDEALATGLDKIGGGLTQILDERTTAIKTESQELRQDVAFLQALVAGHEVVLVEITGEETTPVFPDHPTATDETEEQAA